MRFQYLSFLIRYLLGLTQIKKITGPFGDFFKSAERLKSPELRMFHVDLIIC